MPVNLDMAHLLPGLHAKLIPCTKGARYMLGIEQGICFSRTYAVDGVLRIFICLKML